MKEINRDSTELLHARTERTAAYMSVQKDRLYFTHAAAILYQLEAGKFLHFRNIGKSWHFRQSDDPVGFELLPDRKQTSKAVFLCNRALVRLILKKTGFKNGTRFYLLKTDQQYKGSPLIEIKTDKTYDQFIKQ